MSTTITQDGGILEIQQVAPLGSWIIQYKNATSSTWTTISSFPVTIINGTPAASTKLTVNFTTNITLTSALGGANGFFICGSSFLTFDGLNKIITISGVTNYPGLIRNGTGGTNGFHTITVQNFSLNSTGTTLAGGYLCQNYFGRNTKNIPEFNPSTNLILINNCSNSGVVNSVNSGGVCGQYFGSNSVASITNCYNTGTLSLQTGGICGAFCCSTDGTVSITSCYNTGNVIAYCGGIVGIYALTGYDNVGSLTITSCYNTGNISLEGGGICGPIARGIININKCFNLGNINGQYAGGICGDDFNSNAYVSTPCSITNCYSLGAINGNYSGGICGAGICYMSNNQPTLLRVVNISNCYSVGNIATGAGGILGGESINGAGRFPQNTRVTLTNCFSNGIVTDIGSGLMADSLDIRPYVTVTSCYIGNNAWLDASAQTSLTGTPTTFVPGTTWSSIATNTPYVLSLYNSELYNPKFVSIGTTDYTSEQGLIQPGYTYSIITTNTTNPTVLAIDASNGILTYTGIIFASQILTRVIACKYNSNNFPYDYNVNTFTVFFSVCFKEDTKILCLIDNEEKYVNIQDMKPNMMVKTYDEDFVAVDSIGWFNLANGEEEVRNPNALYELTTEDYPELIENLVLTGRHTILVNDLHKEHLNGYKFARHDKLCNKYKLPCIANEKAKLYNKNGLFKIWSFCLKTEDERKNFGIYANGLLVESTSKRDIKSIEMNFVE
jgi:hypothetical protein